MKKSMITTLALVGIGCGVLIAFAQPNHPTAPAVFNVGVSSVMVVPPRSENGKVWNTTDTYANGSLVMETNSAASLRRSYWDANTNKTAAVSTTQPTHNDGDATDGVHIWRAIPPIPRAGCAVYNDDTNDVWIAIGYDAVANRGVKLEPGEWIRFDAGMQDSVHAISSGWTNRVGTIEW